MLISVLIGVLYMSIYYFEKFKNPKYNLFLNLFLQFISVILFFVGCIYENEEFKTMFLACEGVLIIVLIFYLFDKKNAIFYQRLSMYTGKIIIFGTDFFRRENQLEIIVDTLDEILEGQSIRWLWFSTGRYEDEVIIRPEGEAVIIKQKASNLQQCRVIENRRGNVIFLRFPK